MKAPENERVADAVRVLVPHLHACVDELQPSFAELEAVWGFLQAMGGHREHPEFILASDILGLTTRVVNINAPAGSANHAFVPTPATLLGPQGGEHPRRARGANIDDSPPGRKSAGSPLFFRGCVRSCVDGKPVSGALVDVWGPDDAGSYGKQIADLPDSHLTGVFTASDTGDFYFDTVVPKHYSVPTDGPMGSLLRMVGRRAMRPAHLHFKISAPGFNTLVTHIFPSDTAFLDEDAAHAVQPELVVEIQRTTAQSTCQFDFFLSPSDGSNNSSRAAGKKTS